MWRSIVVLVGLLACKNPTSQVMTIPAQQKLQLEYSSYVLSADAFTFFDVAIDFEKDLSTALKQNTFNQAEHKQLLRIQQHVRSIIAYAVHSRCFKIAPRQPLPAREDFKSQQEYNQQVRAINWHNSKQRAESHWRDRYDYNYHQRGTKAYQYQLSIDNSRLCSIFLNKLRELTLEQIDSSQSNAEFFQKVMANKLKALDDSEMQTAQQMFFRDTLTPQIIKVTEQSMTQANYMYPFQRKDWVEACVAYRDYYFANEAGDRTYRFPQQVREKINCTKLQTLPQVKTKTSEIIDCARQEESFSVFTQNSKAMATAKPFAKIEDLATAVNTTIQGMNAARAELDNLVRLRETYKIKSLTTGKEKQYAPHTEKKEWILPFMKVLNATKIDNNPPVIKAIDAYHCHIVEANKRGILPVIFAKATQQKIGSVHLKHMGRFFGFGKVEYKPLKLPTHQVLVHAVGELQRQLIANWVEMQATQTNTKKINARDIYATILNNEIAVAQLLLQNPAHAVVITHLLRKFQHDPTTPKWLRTFKKFALGADLAFLPIALLGGFVTGGVGTVPILLMMNAVNFLWIGGAAAEQIVARNRYRMLERSLLTGNSEQIARGMKVLRALHEKRRDLIVSGAIGAPLTLGNLTLIARGLDNLATVPIDLTAAFSADVETLSMPEENTSDADLHNRK